MKKLLSLCVLSLTPLLAQAQSAPQASIRLIPTTGSLQTEFVLDASQSRNAAGNTQNLEYQFRADSKLPRTAFSQNPIFRFRAIETGNATAEVIIRDRNTGLITISGHRYTVRASQQQSVRIKVSNLNPGVGESLIYEATVFGNNINRDQLQSRWDFNSDGRWDTSYLNNLKTSFTPQTGKSFPTVEVKFEDGQIIRARGLEVSSSSAHRSQNTLTSFVSVPRNTLKSPVIEVSPRSASIKENVNLSLDASKTETTKNSFLEWVIDGRTIPGKTKINYVFKSSGKKTITLRHCRVSAPDDCLETNTIVNVEAKPNDQFLEVFWQNVSDRGRRTLAKDYALATATDKLRFTVRPEGLPNRNQSFTYRWDFEGDGQWDTEFNDDTFVEHTFNQTGNFVVQVEALPRITTKNFEFLTYSLPVYIERNRAPMGDFNFTQANNFVGEKVTYTAKASDPESEQLIEVRFDSDADGVWDSEFRNQRSWWWVYDEPGNYKVRMQIRDPQGRTKEITKVMTILPMAQPKTQVSVSHRAQTENLNIILDGSASEGRKLTYEWTVQGQPQIKYTTARVNLRLPAGDYQVKLSIRDRLGTKNSVVFPVTFTSQSPVNPLTPIATTTQTSSLVNQISSINPTRNNFVNPPGGVPPSVSPFKVEAGTAISSDGYVSGMRALR